MILQHRVRVALRPHRRSHRRAACRADADLVRLGRLRCSETTPALHGPSPLEDRHAHRRCRHAPGSPTAAAWPRTRPHPGDRRRRRAQLVAGRRARRSAVPLRSRDVLTAVQHDLFDLGGELSIPGHAAITDAHVARLEAAVESFNAGLGPLKEFILPGGARAGGARPRRAHRLPPRRAHRRPSRADAIRQRSVAALPQPPVRSAVRARARTESRRRQAGRALAQGPQRHRRPERRLSATRPASNPWTNPPPRAAATSSPLLLARTALADQRGLCRALPADVVASVRSRAAYLA